MSFPVVSGTNKGNIVVNGTALTIDLPASLVAGDLLFAVVTVDQNTGVAFTNWPSGWTELYAVDNGTNFRQECRYRIATGGEASFTINHALNMSAYVTWREVVGTFDPATPPEASVATGSSATPDPPTLLVSWGVADNGWRAVCGYDVGTRTLDTPAPTAFTVLENERSNNGQGVGLGVAWRDGAGSTLNPGTFAVSISSAWVAATIGIRPFLGGPSAVIAGTAALTLDGSAELDTVAQHIENLLDFTYKAGQSITVLGIVGDVANTLRSATVQVLSDHRDVEFILQIVDLSIPNSANLGILVDMVAGDYPMTFPAPIPLEQLLLSCRLQT